MKLEGLNSQKFEVLSEKAMQFVVGGMGKYETKGSSIVNSSNDYTCNGRNLHMAGGDYSDEQVNKVCSIWVPNTDPTLVNSDGTMAPEMMDWWVMG